MKRFALFFICCAVLGAQAASPQAQVVLDAATTNLVVTEETRIVLRLWLPPLAGELANVPPFLNQRPPHVSAAFLEQNWKTPFLTPVDPRRLPPVESRSRNRDVPVYTLNNYVSDDFFGGMRDPFSLLGDDDFFGRTLGPKAQRFPFDMRRVERAGVKGWEFFFETLPYRAVAPGRAEIAPVAVRVPVITGVRTVRDRFGRAVQRPELKEIRLQTKPLVIEVAEPPAAGRPADYCGAVASNMTVTATLDTSVCTAGDPLLLTLDVAGANDASAVHPPSFASVLHSGGIFRLDEASLKTETLAASRRFSWRVRAVKAGTVEFPPLSVSYYNPDKRAYVTVRTEMIPVQVKAGAQAALGALGEPEDDETFPLPDGIDVDPRGARTDPLLPHLGLACTVFVVSPVLFLLIRLTPPVRRRVAAHREIRRRATAFKKCRNVLKGGNAGKKDAAVRRFFADRYGVNGATVTAADARRLMAGDFMPEEIALVADALTDSDRLNYSAKKTIVSLVIVCLTALSAFAGPTEFTYRRGCALAGRATDESGFRNAEAAFADCVRAGAANPELFANLGAVAVMSGNLRGALAAYRRAECRGGETVSTQRGIRAALAGIKGDPRADLPLTRVFFRPHYLFTLDERLVFAAVMWALCWLSAFLPPGAVRRLLLLSAAMACLAAVVSVSVSLADEYVAERVVYAGK